MKKTTTILILLLCCTMLSKANPEATKIGNIYYILDADNSTASVTWGGEEYDSYSGTEESFWATDDVNVLYPRFELNKYIAMFLITLIEKEKYRFNYGRKWDKESMKQSKIKLPVTSPKNPDWKFMEDYIKSLPYSNLI